MSEEQKHQTGQRLRFVPEDHFFFIDSESLDAVETRLYGYCLVEEGEDVRVGTESFAPQGDGSYIYIHRDGARIDIWQDYVGSYGIYLYRDGDYFALSSSLLLLLEKLSGKHPLHLDRAYANLLFVSWHSSLTCRRTIVEEVQLLDRGLRIAIDVERKSLSFERIDYGENSISIDTAEGMDVLDAWYDRWTAIFRSVARKSSNIKVNLSGGFDSRMVFMLALESGIDLNKILIYSVHDGLHTHKEDYEIASQIAKRYGFTLNREPSTAKTDYGLQDSVNLSFYTKLTLHNQMYYKPSRYDERHYAFPGNGGEILRSYWGSSRESYIENQVEKTRRFPLSVQRELESSAREVLGDEFLRLDEKYGFSQNDSNILDRFYQDGRCRHHFGKGAVESFFANDILLTPLLDRELIKINHYQKGCDDGALLIALIFVRYREDLLDFSFDSGRSVDPKTIEYARELCKRFPRRDEGKGLAQDVVFGEEAPVRTYVPEDGEAGDDSLDSYAGRLLESRMVRGIFLSQFDDSVYRDAANHRDRIKFHPLQKFYPVYSVARVMQHVYARDSFLSGEPREALADENIAAPARDITSWEKEAIEESTARIDINLLETPTGSLSLVGSIDDCLIVKKPSWLVKEGDGMQIESHVRELEFTLKAHASGNLRIKLRGIDMRDENNNLVPVWVVYKTLSCNGKSLLDRTLPAWHNKPCSLQVPVEAEEDITICCTWEPPRGEFTAFMDKKDEDDASKEKTCGNCSVPRDGKKSPLKKICSGLFKGRPLVSVVLPVYNSQAYLSQCLDSILAQSLENIEIICIDDGSTDDSLAILRSYENKDSRVRVVSQQNAGAGAARNTGLRMARGKYLSFLDADDFFDSSMLKSAYEAAEHAHAQIVVFGSDDYYADTDEYIPITYGIRSAKLPQKEPFAGTDIKRDTFKMFVGWAWDKLFARSFLKKNHLLFQEQRTTNDMRFVFAAIAKADRIATLPDRPLAHHRRARGSLSVTRENSWHCFHDALISLREQLLAWGLFKHYEQDFINYCVHASLWNYETLAEPTQSKLADKLRDEWFAEFGVTEHTRGFFYNKSEYERCEKLMQTNFPCEQMGCIRS